MIAYLLTTVSGLAAALIATLVVELSVALWHGTSLMGREISKSERRPRLAVLVPAHNESTQLIPTLTDIRLAMGTPDRLIVVADNCSDDTAQAARSTGAEVVERNDPARRGKGYALEFGLRHLALDPPEVVIIVDADCRLESSALDLLALCCARSGRPAQALYLMIAPAEAQINLQVAEFAWRIKNWLRPLGLSSLGLPCQLMGSGMAFPWAVITLADIGDANIVEDLNLGIQLTAKGYPPLFCPEAKVVSQFASSREAAEAQRVRWEQGHLRMIVKFAFGYAIRGLGALNWRLVAQAIDLAIPPLSLLLTIALLTFGASLVAWVNGVAVAALVISGASTILLVGALALAWLKCGQQVLPIRDVLLTVSYVLGKMGIYAQFCVGRAQSNWIRTERAAKE